MEATAPFTHRYFSQTQSDTVRSCSRLTGSTTPGDTRFLPQSGLGLIESIVTLLVISLGVLALAFMQLWGQRYGQDSAARTQATLIAMELMDRIRTTEISASDITASAYTTTPSGTLTCDPGIVDARNDRDCFYLRINERLPTGAGAISIDGLNRYRISIAWVDRYANKQGNADNLSESDCTDRNRIWFANKHLNWHPAETKPSEPTCLYVQHWTLIQ